MFPETLTPDVLRRLEYLRLETRRAFHGQREGGHISPKRGMGLEFSDYRQYEPGDNPRNIDWGAYARTDKLYVKRYREEENLSVLILVDASLSMRHERAPEKWKFARLLSLAIAYIALNNRDTVKVCFAGLPPSPAFFGARAIHDVVRYIKKLEEKCETTDRDLSLSATVHEAASCVRFPGLGIVISDFLFSPQEFSLVLTALGSKNLELHAIQVLGSDDLNPLEGLRGGSILDSETGDTLDLSLNESDRAQYSNLLHSHCEELRNKSAMQQVKWTQAHLLDSSLELLYSTLTNAGLAR